MNIPTVGGLLAPKDIADMAGVSRAAVSNWRKRLSDFPEPASGTASKPLFLKSDVEAWLVAHPGKTKSKPRSGEGIATWEGDLWGVLNRLRGRVGTSALSRVIVQLAVGAFSDEKVQAKGKGSADVDDELRQVIESIPRGELVAVVDRTLERLVRSEGRSGGNEGFVGSRISTMLATLGSHLQDGTLYDPACGIGVALLQAVQMGARPERLVGDEIHQEPAAIARGRAKLKGIDLNVYEGDVLRVDPDPDLRADLIIAEPPFGLKTGEKVSSTDARWRFGVPPKSRADSLWLQHVVAHLAPGGTGYVVTTRGLLIHGGAESEIRRNLLQGGHVKTIVALPGKMLPYTSIPVALWVLGDGAGEQRGDVLFINAEDVEAPETLVDSWLSDDGNLAAVPHAYVQVADLVTEGADLNPLKWVPLEVADTEQLREVFKCSSTQIADLAVDLQSVAHRLIAPAMAEEPKVLTVRQLIEADIVELMRSTLSSKSNTQYSVSGRDIRAGVLPQVADPSLDDGDQSFTLPGDLLVATANGISAVVDELGGHVPGLGVHWLRITDSARLDPRFLADSLTGNWNQRFGGGTVAGASVRDLEVPMLSVEAQRELSEVVDAARKAQQLAEQVRKSANSVTETLLAAARKGITL
ncbi:N-6 DNA methylase [Brevibacterium sp. 91QC2O2]|uniref:N-6 DNA methylase n=1 Tax=Brevibacterium sp. 91QC2O2 TaxID=2968458 RepID=UPI00211CF366|nr:N-6 DNA methylase [Brevibacterium sp. 91QC2O2]MCQ9368647.1 N-6 DNA methylase [Brevibacterium sp. 91QC2O2]